MKQVKNLPYMIAKSFYDYVKSCLFLSFLVGLQRGGLCINYGLSQENMLSFCMIVINVVDNLLVFSPVSASSILFEDSSRRTEVTNYVCAKAIRSLYMFCKRTLGLKSKNEVVYMHMLMMSLLYYVFNHQADILKFRNLF